MAVSAPQKSRAVFARDRFRAGPGCGIISSAASSGAMRKDEFAMMIRIRPATPDDARELIDMNREFNGVDDLDEEQVRAELAGGAEQVFVADAGERLAGYCCVQRYKSFCYRKGIAELTELYVREEFRHKGLASRMITAHVDALRAQGVGELEVITAAANAGGHAVYRANGFRDEDWACLSRKL